MECMFVLSVRVLWASRYDIGRKRVLSYVKVCVQHGHIRHH
jgi:hypothetical protein